MRSVAGDWMTCKPCEQYRREMGEALSQAAFIKAAKIAMQAAAYAVTGKQKEGKKDE